MPSEVIDVVRPTTAALAVMESRSMLVEPAADFTTTVKAFKSYQKLRDTLLNDSDFQNISGKRFVKKSGWRKLAVAFGVSDEIVREAVERDPDTGRIVRAECVVRAIAPNGRYSEGVGVCDLSERKFSKPEHDIPATAHTRAKSRACSDLFGFGEVSAEEMANENPPAAPNRISTLVEALKDAELDGWVKDQGFAWPWTDEVCDVLLARLTEVTLAEFSSEPF